MENENKEAKNDADTTANQTAPTGEQKTEEKKGDTPEVPGDETVTLSKKELETLQKKAKDFEDSIVLKNLKKLQERGESKTPDSKDELNARLETLEQEIAAQKANTFNSGLTEAYRSFVNDNPWANDDEKFDKIKEKFSAVGTETKEELLAKMKLAAQTAFPTEYEKHLEDKIKAEVFKDKANSNPGGSAAPATNLHKDEDLTKTEEQKTKDRLGSMLRREMTWIKK
jgi:hypothetical protein